MTMKAPLQAAVISRTTTALKKASMKKKKMTKTFANIEENVNAEA
jgi:hypothetical protein